MNSNQLNRPLFSIRNIHKFFGYKQVLKGINLEFSENQVTLLVGKNGAGKSTLVKILTGLMRPTEGNVNFRGENIQNQAEIYRKAIGVITHDILFYGDLTARENLRFFGKLRSIENLDKEIQKALKDTGLQKATDMPVKTFSSGMCKRLNIARLMLSGPKILFLDEPYSGLDFDSIALLNEYIAQIKQNGGAILLISHQVDACFDYIDRAAYLINGEISRLVPKSELNQTDLPGKFHVSDGIN
ncbi:heme ABC exporter ATP-binding protein CcmA [bacterium]|nr:heme ABC exporter ATP-binding protein CcmA [bacterium]